MIEANSQDDTKKISVSCNTLNLDAGHMFDEGDSNVLIMPRGVITGPHLREPKYQGIGEWPNNVTALAVGFPFYYPSNWTLDRSTPQFELHLQNKFP